MVGSRMLIGLHANVICECNLTWFVIFIYFIYKLYNNLEFSGYFNQIIRYCHSFMIFIS